MNRHRIGSVQLIALLNAKYKVETVLGLRLLFLRDVGWRKLNGKIPTARVSVCPRGDIADDFVCAFCVEMFRYCRDGVALNVYFSDKIGRQTDHP